MRKLAKFRKYNIAIAKFANLASQQYNSTSSLQNVYQIFPAKKLSQIVKWNYHIPSKSL